MKRQKSDIIRPKFKKMRGGGKNAENESVSVRPRRSTKPSSKSMENTTQLEHSELERAWGKVLKAVTTLQNAPNSIKEICKTITQVRTEYNIYDSMYHCFVNFLTHFGTRKCMEELSKLSVLAQNKKFVDENIEQGNLRKQELSLEIQPSAPNLHPAAHLSHPQRFEPKLVQRRRQRQKRQNCTKDGPLLNYNQP